MAERFTIQHMIRRRTASVAAALGLALFAACEQMPFEPTEETFTAARGETVSAAEFNGRIRIGVVPSAAAVTLGASGAWELVEKSSGNVVLTGSGGTLQVTIQTPAQIVTVWGLQIVCSNDVAAIQSLLAPAQAAGFATDIVPNTVAGCLRGLIISPDPGFTFRVNFRNARIAEGLAPPTSFWVSFSTISAAVLGVTGPSSLSVKDGAILRPTSGHVTINGQAYRGVAEAAPNSAGTLAGINELPIEEYLYGVVPRELPPVPYGELEALKAQAVAARTYALRGLGKRAADGYDLLPTTTDQVYGGLAAEHPLSTQAVDETAGIVARYNGALIEALYSSTSGGFTANNEEVFNSAPVPYLRGKPDAQRGSSLEHAPSHAIFKYDRNASSLRGMKNGDYEGDWSRYHRWTFEWTAEEISQVISAFAQQNVGRVHAINVLERGPSGRVQRIEYVTDAGSFFDTKDRIRSSLRFFNDSGTMSSLLSTLFYIDPVTDKRTNEVTGFVAYGGGWGHGVGMSQTGAVGMAEKNATYAEILKFYYSDITLDRIY